MWQDTTLHGLTATFNHRLYGAVSGTIVKSHLPSHAPNYWTLNIFSEQTGMIHEVDYFNCKIAYSEYGNDWGEETRKAALELAHDRYSAIMANSSGLWLDRIQAGYRFW